MTISSGGVLDHAIALVQDAASKGLQLRIAGSAAVLCYVGPRQERRPTPVKDIDLVTRKEYRKAAQKYMAGHGWILVTELLMLSEFRETYTNPSSAYAVDLYYDQIDGNHPTVIRDRLHVSFPAISLTDLLFSKLQRVHLRESDVWDCCELLRLASCEVECAYFKERVGSNWGFYTTLTGNLAQLAMRCSGATSRVTYLLQLTIESRKTLCWWLRSLPGRHIKWWRDVYETSLPQPRG